MPQPNRVMSEVRLENQPKTSAPPGVEVSLLLQTVQELMVGDFCNLPYETFR